MSRARRRRLNEEFASDDARAWESDYANIVLDWVRRARKYDRTLTEPTNFYEYLNVLEDTNQHALQCLENAADLGSNRVGAKLLTHRETESIVPLYIWVRDGVEAVFAVAVLSRGKDAGETAFLTRDRGLVTALEAAFGLHRTERRHQPRSRAALAADGRRDARRHHGLTRTATRAAHGDPGPGRGASSKPARTRPRLRADRRDRTNEAVASAWPANESSAMDAIVAGGALRCASRAS